MEYIGVCLDRSPTDPTIDILPFGGGGCLKVHFTSDGKSVLGSGDQREGLKAWKLLQPLSATEKRILQAEEDAKRLIATAALAGIEANKENEREARFLSSEREKQRQFQQEMEKEKELERNELLAEQQSIVEDGGDLLIPYSINTSSNLASPSMASSSSQLTTPSAMKGRRPSELPNLNTSSSAAASASNTAQKTPRVVGWLDEEILANKEKDKVEKENNKRSEKRGTLMRKGTLTNLLAAASSSGGGGGGGSEKKANRRGTLKIKKVDSDSDDDDDSPRKKLPTLMRSSSKLHILKSPASNSNKSPSMKLPLMSPSKGATPSSSGASTARLPSSSSNNNTKSQQPSGSATSRSAKDNSKTTFEAKTTFSVQSELRTKVTLDPAGARVTTTTQQTFVGVTTTTRTPASSSSSASDRRKTGTTEGFTTPRSNHTTEKSPYASPLSSKKDEGVSTSGERRERRGTMRRRRGDSDDEDETTTTPSKKSTTNFLTINTPNNTSPDDARRSIRLSSQRRGVNNGGGDSTPHSSRSSLTPTPVPQLPQPFQYSDFEMDSLSAKLRIPFVVKPPMARLLPIEPNFADIHAGGIWCLNHGDETIITTIKQYEGVEKTPCKKLMFIDRIKGKVTVCEKSHNGIASCMTLSEDGRKCIVGTKSGHAYVHTFDSPKWTYLWLKLRETDDPVPNLDLAFSPNGLALLASRQTKDSPITVWNVKTNKLLANLNGGMSPGANENISPSVIPTSLTYHLGTNVKGVWTPDSEHVFTVGWDMEDRTVRMWRTVTRGMNPRTTCLGRLNTPYTHFRTPTNFFSHAMAVSPNGKLLAIGLGLTLFLFNVEKQKCIQYVTLFDLMSQAEAEKDEALAPNWIDPFAVNTQHLFPTALVNAHTFLPALITPVNSEMNEPLSLASSSLSSSSATTAPTSPAAVPTMGRQRSSIGSPTNSTSSSSSQQQQQPALNKRSSLTKNGLDVMNTTVINKRGSMGREFLIIPTNNNGNKRSSTQRNAGGADSTLSPPGLNKKGSLTRTTGASSATTSTATTNDRSQFLIQATDSSFHAPAHTTPILTYFTSLAFSPSSSSLAVATSIGGIGVYELTARVCKGEEEREQIDLFLFPERRTRQKSLYKAREHERIQFLAQEQARKKQSEQAEREREEERRAHRERAAERESRRNAREEARRLKLYAGSLPDLNYLPTPSKLVPIEPFFREGYNASLLAAVEEKGDFLVRLDDDVDGRRRRAEERLKLKEVEDAALLSAAIKLHGGPDLKPSQREQKQNSFMQRLNKDLSKRKDFRITADAGEYYHKIKDPRNAIISKPVLMTQTGNTGTLPAIR